MRVREGFIGIFSSYIYMYRRRTRSAFASAADCIPILLSTPCNERGALFLDALYRPPTSLFFYLDRHVEMLDALQFMYTTRIFHRS